MFTLFSIRLIIIKHTFGVQLLFHYIDLVQYLFDSVAREKVQYCLPSSHFVPFMPECTVSVSEASTYLVITFFSQNIKIVPK